MTPKLEALVERLSDCRDISSLQSSLLAADLEACDVADYIRFDRDGYSRNRVLKTDKFEVLILCWRPGQKSKIHNHADSICAFKIIKGALKNTNFIQQGQRVSVTSTKDISCSQPVVLSGSNNFHKIANDSASNAVSLHFYAPPIGHYHVVDQEKALVLIEEAVL